MPTQPITHDEADIPLVQRVVAVLWPSFLTAILATALFFSLFDPADLGNLLGKAELSAIAGYTIGFFAFWTLTAIASGLALYFGRPCHPPQRH